MNPESLHVEVRGVRVHVGVCGAGPPVFLLPGLGLTSRIYAPNCRDLASAGFRVFVPDFPGFGRTPGRRLGLSVDEMAAWLVELATALESGAASWIGHSLSCQAAMLLAAREPSLARALVLIAPTGAGGQHRVLRQLLRFAQNVFREPPLTVLAVLRDYMKNSPLHVAGTWLKSMRDRPHARLTGIRCPTLVLLGTRDPVIPRSYLLELAQRIPHAHLEWLAGAAHGAPFDRRLELDCTVATFLREAVP